VEETSYSHILCYNFLYIYIFIVADEAYEHYLAVKDHPLGRCYEPTPELRHIPPEGNKLYFPEYTILHVCRNVSGCCWNPMQECAEKDIEIVSKSFIVSI